MRWKGWHFCSVLPRGHGNIAPCQGNVWVVSLLWVVELQILSVPYNPEVWYHLLWVCTPGILFQVCRMSNFQHWLSSLHCKVTWVSHQVFRWSSRLFLGMQRRSLSKLVPTLGIPLALTFSLGICLDNMQCPLVIAFRNIFPKER